MTPEETLDDLCRMLEADAKEFDRVADRCESLQQHVVHNGEKQNLRNEMKYYRDIAESHRRQIKILRERK
jgi:hypothetical protein